MDRYWNEVFKWVHQKGISMIILQSILSGWVVVITFLSLYDLECASVKVNPFCLHFVHDFWV